MRLGITSTRILFCRLLQRYQCHFRQLLGMLMTTFVHTYPWDGKIMLINCTYCADRFIAGPWRFPNMGCNKLVKLLSTQTSIAVYCWLIGVYPDMNSLTSDAMRLCITADSRFTYLFWIFILSQSHGVFTRSVAVDELVSMLLLHLSGWWIGWNARRSTRLWSSCTLLRCLCSNHLLLWKRRRRW